MPDIAVIENLNINYLPFFSPVDLQKMSEALHPTLSNEIASAVSQDSNLETYSLSYGSMEGQSKRRCSTTTSNIDQIFEDIDQCKLF
jgi:hypothetical protein